MALLVLSFTVVNLIRFYQAITLWDMLTSLSLSVSPLYLALSGLVWGLVGLPLSWGIWRGRAWARRALWLSALSFAGYYWVDRFIVASDPGRWVYWPFRLGATLALLLLVYWIFSRPRVKAFFGEPHG